MKIIKLCQLKLNHRLYRALLGLISKVPTSILFSEYENTKTK